MKKRFIFLSILMLIGCFSLNTSNNISSSSNITSSSSITDGKLIAKTLEITPLNYNELDYIEIEGVVDNSQELFTFNPLATLKTKGIKNISRVSIHVYQTYSYLSLYTDYECGSQEIESEKTTGNREAIYTYELNNSDKICIKNTSDKYLTHVYGITIGYYDVVSENNGTTSSSTSNSNNNSSSSFDSSSSSSKEDDKPINTLKQGLKGSEWFSYYGSESGSACLSIPSIGDPSVLVVPVLFKNESIDDSEQVLYDIDKAFNGASSDTSWESVDSFYQKSSYNMLDMDIEVLDYWITLDKTCTEIAKLDTNTYIDPTWYALEYVVKQLKNKGMDMKQYDSNSDGFIDGIWMVYGKNYSSATTDQQDIMWAYTYWKYDNQANVNNPVANVYAWASVEFMYEGNYSKPDAHTFIHETGHMLGLDDYYDYDENSLLRPAGCLDMMDYNIGDHNAYSKYLLDWVEPIYVNEECSITIKPFESSGDCIVVPTSLIEPMSPLNEYLIIEYYTPTGLNKSDSQNKYQGSYPLMFTESGIKIYHVDSRIGKVSYSNDDYIYGDYSYDMNYDELFNNSDYYSYYDIFASNTSSYSANSNYKKLTLLSSNQNSKKGYYYKNTNAKNVDLYQSGDSIKTFSFNRGTSLLFEISIENITSTGATIKFS